jgi:hypothetical protein
MYRVPNREIEVSVDDVVDIDLPLPFLSRLMMMGETLKHHRLSPRKQTKFDSDDNSLFCIRLPRAAADDVDHRVCPSHQLRHNSKIC